MRPARTSPIPGSASNSFAMAVLMLTNGACQAPAAGVLQGVDPAVAVVHGVDAGTQDGAGDIDADLLGGHLAQVDLERFRPAEAILKQEADAPEQRRGEDGDEEA